MSSTNAQVSTLKKLFDVTQTLGGNNTTVLGAYPEVGVFAQNPNLHSGQLFQCLHYNDTLNVKNFRYGFYKCTGLTTVPLFSLKNAELYNYMFSGCTSLISLPNFKFETAHSLTGFCTNCSSLTTIPDWDLSLVTSLTSAFGNCTSLTSLTFTKPISGITDTSGFDRVFYGCTNLQTISMTFVFPSSTRLSQTFYNCSSLKSIPAWDCTNVIQFDTTFSGCSSLETVHLTNIRYSLNLSASTQFTRDALNEIIGNLVDVGANRTLTIGATNLAKLTSDDIAVATAKGWTLA